MNWEGEFPTCGLGGVEELQSGYLGANPLPSDSEVRTYFPGLHHDPVSQCEESCCRGDTHFPQECLVFNEGFLYIWDSWKQDKD